MTVDHVLLTLKMFKIYSVFAALFIDFTETFNFDQTFS